MAGTGLAAIIAGGVLAAFSAHAPTQPLVWASAYLVLVVGVAQVALAASLSTLAPQSTARLLLLVVVAYNLGNIDVLVGTLNNSSWLVVYGGVALIAAVLLSVYIVRHAKRSWLLTVFYLVATILLVSTPIGVFLSYQ